MATYQDPGVYVQVTNTPVVSSVGNGPISMCIVGPGLTSLPQIDNSLFFKNSYSINTLSQLNVTTSGSNSTLPTPLITNTFNSNSSSLSLGTDYQLGYAPSNASAANNSNLLASSTFLGTGVTTLSTTGTPSSGTATLSFYVNGQPLLTSSGNQVTTSVAYNASASSLSNAITNAIATGYINGSPTSLALLNSAVTVTNALGVSATPTIVQFGSPITAISSNSTTWTITANNNFAANQYVTITGIPSAYSAYNGNWQIASATATGFTITNNSNPGSVTGLTTASIATPGATSTVAASNNPLNIITFSVSTSGYSSGTSLAATNTITNASLTANYTYSTNYGNKVLFFNSPNAVNQTYGSPLNSNTGQINSPISLAAQMAFLNGATQVYCLAVGNGTTTTDTTVAASPTAAQWQQTINYCLGGNGNIDTIVPLLDYNSTPISGTITIPSAGTPQSWVSFFNTYTGTQSSNGTLQRFFLSRDSSTNTPNITAATALIADAAAFNNQRISVFAPNALQMSTTNTTTNQVIQVPGYYGAAAVAGIYASQPGPQEPLTHKTVNGFYGINPTYSVNDYLSMQGNGVLCLKQRSNGTIYVRHGLTTNTSNWLTEEISIIGAQDQLYRLIKANLVNSNLIGSALTPNTASVIISTVQTTLANAVIANLIQSYSGIQYQQSSTYPVSVTVQFQYSPTFPLNYINVSFSIDPTAGTIQFSPTVNSTNTFSTGA